MNITHILVFTAFAFIFGWLIPQRFRLSLLLVSSIIAIYWLQPSSPIRNIDFWFPTLSICLTVFVWAVTCRQENIRSQPFLFAAIIVIGLILLLGLTRYFDHFCCIGPSRPPQIMHILLVVGFGSAIAVVPYFFFPRNRYLSYFSIGLILGLFIILKSESFSEYASIFLRRFTGQDITLAATGDLPWLGFSYLAFRLLHVLRDFQTGVLPDYNLGEFIIYGIFFPSYTAGPIDRSQPFIKNLQSATTSKISLTFIEDDFRIYGLRRILVGIFKKFVIADTLALIALNAQNAPQVTSSFWMWILLYAFALRIYYDFSGYTDVAIGLGVLMGIKLPENFKKPYLQQNITAFWNSWHMTLAQWFRSYFFNPLTRILRSKRELPAWLIIFISQLSTMLLIGLWHGITWNFAIWGIWHGVGLFIHNRWVSWVRPRFDGKVINPFQGKLISFSSWLLTFNFVVLSWVWFATPDPELAIITFKKLFGI